MAGLLESLAQIAPSVMSGFGNKTETFDRVRGIRQENEAQADQKERKERLRKFVQLMTQTDGPVTTQKLYQNAQAAGIDPDDAAKVGMDFVNFRKAAAPEKQKFSRVRDDGRIQAGEFAPGNPMLGDGNWEPGTITGSPQSPILQRGLNTETGDPMIGLYDLQNRKFEQVGGMVPDPNATGGVSVEVNNLPEGNMPLTGTTANTVQKGLYSDMDAVGRMWGIYEDYKPEMLTYWGKIQNFGRGVVDKLGVRMGEEDKKALQQWTRFKNRVEQNFNLYRKDITGAAASVQELDRLLKSMFNTGQGPNAFEASAQLFFDELRRSARLKRKLLREGIDMTEKEGGAVFDMGFLGGDQADSLKDAYYRGKELEAQGLNREQIDNILIKEGYLSE